MTTPQRLVAAWPGVLKRYGMAWRWKHPAVLSSARFGMSCSSTVTLRGGSADASYRCRVIDMLYMGYVDAIVSGREALTRLPASAREWKAAYGCA